MRQHLLNAAQFVYSHTPSLHLRALYLKIFSRLVNGRRVCVTNNGITYALDLSEAIDVALYLDRYESDVTATIDRLTMPDMVVFDIGANIGAHALRFAKLVGDGGRVYAFEPTEYAYRKLTANIQINSFVNIFPVQVALSNQNAKNQPGDFRSSWLATGGARPTMNSVDFVRLDDWCMNNNVTHVDLVKLDVDGFEFNVLSGALNILHHCHPAMIMEVFGPNLRERAVNPFVLLYDMGYQFFDIQSGRVYSNIDELKAPLSLSDGTVTDASYNVIALHSG